MEEGGEGRADSKIEKAQVARAYRQGKIETRPRKAREE